MSHKTAWIAVALLPALLAFSPGSETEIRFAPAEGTKTVKVFENVVELTLDSMQMKMNGQDSPMMPDMDMTMTSKQKVAVTDTYEKMREGAPARLRRTFDTVGNKTQVSVQIEMMGQSQSQDQNIDGESELEGKTVVFTWDADAGAYKPRFDPEGGEEELLEDLFEDMDLRSLLPTGAVEKDQEWSIPVKSLAGVLAPGGNLRIVPEQAEGADMFGSMPGMGSISDWLSELLEGEATGTFGGTREVDGRELAIIRVKVEIESARDMTDMVKEMMEKAGTPPGAPGMEFDHMDIEYSVTGEGELLWDVKAGRAHSFELSGPTRMTMDMGMSIEIPGQGGMEIEQSLEMSGTTTVSVTFE